MRMPIEVLSPVLPLSHGRTVGGEPKFRYPDVVEAINSCTRHGIAILGVELFSELPNGYRTDSISSYEFGELISEWRSFLKENNNAAISFVEEHPARAPQFYLLTASLQQETLP